MVSVNKRVMNLQLVQSMINQCGSDEEINSKLDELINTTRIFYTSIQDYKENFPNNNDINAKINLIVNRRQ